MDPHGNTLRQLTVAEYFNRPVDFVYQSVFMEKRDVDLLVALLDLFKIAHIDNLILPPEDIGKSSLRNSPGVLRNTPSVAVSPGDIALTLIPKGLSSAAIALVSDIIAPFDAV